MGVSSVLGSSALLPAGLGFRNVIINGGFDVWQRGTGSIAPGNGVITNADRWVHTGNTTTFTQQTDVPAGFRYSLGVSGSDPSFAQKIEAANSARLASQTVTFSIWAKSVSGSTSLFVNFYYPSAVDNFASLTTISSTTIATTVSSSWTRYTLTVALPANVTNGLQVLVGRSAGASNTYFTGVQLEQNLQPTPFEQRPIGVELALCQRYYYLFGNGDLEFIASTSVNYIANFPIFEMRATPTVTQTTYSTTNAYSNPTIVAMSRRSIRLVFVPISNGYARCVALSETKLDAEL